MLALVVLAAVGLIGASSQAVAQGCTAGTESDFDGDGKVDLAIGDPDATVSGKARAGRVHIAYGNGTTQTINGGEVPGYDNGAGERFGFVMDTVDWNGDGCTDLFIGNPYENMSNNTLLEAGSVVFVPGSPAGLDMALAKNWSSAIHGADSAKANVRFGWDLAAGLDKAGKPYLVVGMPGRDTITASGEMLVDIGAVVYIRPTAAKLFNQNSAGISDSFEAGDMFGYAVAASESGFVVGVPGESANYSPPLEDVGTVFLLAHNDATSVPTQIASWGQDSAGVSGAYEAGDMYGYSLDMVDYIGTGGGAPRMMIAVGAPGEAIGPETSSGLSAVLWSPGTGITEYKDIHQGNDGITTDGAEPGDMFGAEVAMVNRTPGQITGVNTLLLTVGVPGEDDETGGFFNVGEAQLFSMTESHNQENNPVRSLLPADKFTPADGANLGQVLHATKQYLFVSATGATGPAVYRIPWDNLVAGDTAPVEVYTPATFGLANTDVVSFGASLA